jgi:hypothetical protein
MASYGFGYTATGSGTDVDRYSLYAATSLENTVRLSSFSRQKLKEDFTTYAPEASAAYFVDIELDEDD